MTQNEFSVCKAEAGGDVAAALTDDNAADGNSGKSFGEIYMIQHTRAGQERPLAYIIKFIT